MLLDIFTQKLTNKLVENFQHDLSSILLFGSKASGEPIDFWSDTDLILLLKRKDQFSLSVLSEIIAGLGRIVAREVHSNADGLVVRYILQHQSTVKMIDLSIYDPDEWQGAGKHPQSYIALFGQFPESEKSDTMSTKDFSYPPESIDDNWFRYYQCVKKYMRRDKLIGTHLLLELLQENLILKMIDRDKHMETNVHRYGYDEEISWMADLPALDLDNKLKLLDILIRLSQWYDQRLITRVTGYESRYKAFADYVEESRQQLK